MKMCPGILSHDLLNADVLELQVRYSDRWVRVSTHLFASGVSGHLVAYWHAVTCREKLKHRSQRPAPLARRY
jgi:hypothetical protein